MALIWAFGWIHVPYTAAQCVFAGPVDAHLGGWRVRISLGWYFGGWEGLVKCTDERPYILYFARQFYSELYIVIEESFG